jgi:hypothetical protein
MVLRAAVSEPKITTHGWLWTKRVQAGHKRRRSAGLGRGLLGREEYLVQSIVWRWALVEILPSMYSTCCQSCRRLFRCAVRDNQNPQNTDQLEHITPISVLRRLLPVAGAVRAPTRDPLLAGLQSSDSSRNTEDGDPTHAAPRETFNARPWTDSTIYCRRNPTGRSIALEHILFSKSNSNKPKPPDRSPQPWSLGTATRRPASPRPSTR